jgi:hypothetical protein
VPGLKNPASPTCRGEAAGQISHQHCGFQSKSRKAERWTGYLLVAAAEPTKPIFEPNTASRTHLTRTTAISLAMIVNTLSNKSYSYSAAKYLVYHTKHLTRWQTLEDMEFWLENLEIWALFATLDEIQLHQITFKSRLFLEDRTLMLCHCPCGMGWPD